MSDPIPRREFLAVTAAGAAAGFAAPAGAAEPRPRTEFEGPTLKFDFPALQIGVAEYAEGPTGCTVFYFPKGAQCAVDIRGGSPGTILAGDGWLDALCYAGGSLYGLEAATGVVAELFARRKRSTAWNDIALVRGAIIFDFAERKTAIIPDRALGQSALKAAKTGVFPLGPRGAGVSATVGKTFGREGMESAGQGGAFRQIGKPKIAVFSVVNALGALVNRKGETVRGHRDPKTGQRRSAAEELERWLAAAVPAPAHGNTTLTAVVTNQKLAAGQLAQLARQVHASLARAIQPVHAPADGDVLYAITTNEVDEKELSPTVLGIVAAELLWDAVLACFVA